MTSLCRQSGNSTASHWRCATESNKLQRRAALVLKLDCIDPTLTEMLNERRSVQNVQRELGGRLRAEMDKFSEGFPPERVRNWSTDLVRNH
jgi:hypothetical protein